MNHHRLLPFLAVSILTLALTSTLIQAQTPCRGINTLRDCPDEGCGGTGFDPELNRMKNRTQEASSPRRMTLGQIRQLRQPARWPVGQERSSLSRSENMAVVVTGFLTRAKVSGRESTNCRLPGRDNNDIHLDLVSNRNDPRATSVTAEITPRIRREHEGWEPEMFDFLADEKTFVRVTGWMMLDTQHIRSPLTRSTNWEVHPVTEFEVCTGSVRDCQQGRNWVRLDEFEP